MFLAPTCSSPCRVIASLLSGMHASVPGTHAARTPSRNARIRSRLRAGSDMSRRIASSPSCPSASVCPWNIRRDTGRQLPGAPPAHSNRKPVRSPNSLTWCVGISVSRALRSRSTMLRHVASSSPLSGCSANARPTRSIRREGAPLFVGRPCI